MRRSNEAQAEGTGIDPRPHEIDRPSDRVRTATQVANRMLRFRPGLRIARPEADRLTDHNRLVRVTESTAHDRPGSERRFDGVQLENRQIGTLGRRKPALGQDFLKLIT